MDGNYKDFAAIKNLREISKSANLSNFSTVAEEALSNPRTSTTSSSVRPTAMLYVFPLFHYGTLAALLSATMISPFARRNVAWFPKESSRFMLELGKIALKNPVKLPIKRNLYQIACRHLNITNVRTMISFLTDFFLSESALVLVDSR